VSDILRKEGPKGLYKGFWPLFYRDVPSWGVYFWAYELLKENSGINKTEKAGEILTYG
jgi:Mitochondrial carrier protein